MTVSTASDFQKYVFLVDKSLVDFKFAWKISLDLTPSVSQSHTGCFFDQVLQLRKFSVLTV